MAKGVGSVFKYILFGLNLVILLGGLCVLGLGIWGLTNKKVIANFQSREDQTAAGILFIIAGLVVVIIAFFGCWGAHKEVKWMLLMYFIVLLLIFLFLLVGSILLFVYRDKVGTKLKNALIDSVPKYSKNKDFTKGWDELQKDMKCCGVEVDNKPGYDIWKKSPTYSQTEQVPKSCCKDKFVSACQASPATGAHKEGCYKKLQTVLKENATVIGGVGLAFAFILVFGMILSCELYRRIGTEK